MIDFDLSNIVTNPAPKTTGLPLKNELLIPSPSGEAGHYTLTIDNSGFTTILECPTKARNYLILGKVGLTNSLAIIFGGAIHAGLESYLRGESIASQQGKIFEYYEQHPGDSLDDYRTPILACKVLELYKDCTAPIKVCKDITGELLVEKTFALPLGYFEPNYNFQLPTWEAPRLVKRINVTWSGKIDVVTANSRGEVYGMDHKTASSSAQKCVEQYNLSNQFMGYAWAMKQLWPELNPVGMTLDTIVIGKGADPAQDLLAPGPRNGPPKVQFFRNNFIYPEERLERWKANVLANIAQFINWLGSDIMPMNLTQCFSYFTKCPYFDACTLDKVESEMRFLNSDVFRNVQHESDI